MTEKKTLKKKKDAKEKKDVKEKKDMKKKRCIVMVYWINIGSRGRQSLCRPKNESVVYQNSLNPEIRRYFGYFKIG